MPHPAVADAKALLEKKQKSKNATAMMCKRMMRQLDDLEPAVTSIVTQTTTQHEKIDKAEDMFKVLLASGYMVMKEKKKPQAPREAKPCCARTSRRSKDRSPRSAAGPSSSA